MLHEKGVLESCLRLVRRVCEFTDVGKGDTLLEDLHMTSYDVGIQEMSVKKQLIY